METNLYQDILISQRKFFVNNRKKDSLYKRKQKLKSLKKWIKLNADYIVSELRKDFNKSEEEVLISEIRPVITEIRDVIHNLNFWAEPTKKETPLALLGTSAKTILEPKGNTLIIAPWNFPFNLAIGPLVSALAAGCTAVIKPSENTPHCEKVIQRLVKEVFTPNEVHCIIGGVQETTQLLKLNWDHIFFTGSPMVGKIVMKAAAEHLTSVTLELGGENPVIVDKKCNLKDTAQKLIWGKFMNSGQSCISPNVLFVHQEILADFKLVLIKEYNKIYKSGQKEKSNPEFAHIVNANHFERVKNLIDTTTEQGGKIILGGETEASCNYIAPTIIENVNIESTIYNEEIFGPVLPIIVYTSVTDVIAKINAKDKPLALYVFTKSRAFYNRIIKETSAGTTVINDTTIQFTHPNLPFGGVNNSGIGKAHGEYGYREFSNERAILKQRRGLTMPKFIYPPYTGVKKKLIRFLTWRM